MIDYKFLLEREDNHMDKYALVNENTAFALVGKCANSALALMYFRYKGLSIEDDYEYKHLGKLWPLYDEKYSISYQDLVPREAFKVCAVIRDPVERLISAKSSVQLDEVGMDEYIESIYGFYEKFGSLRRINNHLAYQSIHYNPANIDVFVWMEHLPAFIASLGLENIYANRSRERADVATVRAQWGGLLRAIYKPDYDMLAAIPPERLWTPPV